MPSDEHPHAFLIYPRDLLLDDKVDSMTHLEFAAYMRLLLKAWFEKPAATIPTDDRDLARMTRMSTKQWTKCKAAVLACFRPYSNTRLIQPRLSKEFQKLMAKKKLRSEAGKKGADSRWSEDDGNAIATACDCHGNRMATPDQSHGIQPNITQNQLTQGKNKPITQKGGPGGKSGDNEPPGSFSSSSSGSLVAGFSGFSKPADLPWETLQPSHVFHVFRELFVEYGIPGSGDLAAKVHKCKANAARWTMLFLDKVQYIHELGEGGEEDNCPVALTMSGFLPRKGGCKYAPTDAAGSLFREIFVDAAAHNGSVTKWPRLDTEMIAVELRRRKKGRR